MTKDLQHIENRIFTFRDQQVMIDFDLAELYQVETKRLNEQVKRNAERFPIEFMFQLKLKEWEKLQSQMQAEAKVVSLRSQIATAKRRTLPYAFTEQGVAMLSAVLRSDIAVQVSIQIMNAFVAMRKQLHSNQLLLNRLDRVELKQLEADQKFEQIFSALERKNPEPEQGIFYDGQVFDAYQFVADLIRKADQSIILLDNYVDDTVLTLLSKRKEGVDCLILTKDIGKQLQLDIDKHKTQYPPIAVKVLDKAHDLFLILDKQEIYHIGASLKDLGKRWFAFSKLDASGVTILENLKGLGYE